MSLSQVNRCLSCQCGISLEMLLPHLAGAVTETAELEDGRLRIWAHSGTEGAASRRCGQFSARGAQQVRHACAVPAPGTHKGHWCQEGIRTVVSGTADATRFGTGSVGPMRNMSSMRHGRRA